MTADFVDSCKLEASSFLRISLCCTPLAALTTNAQSLSVSGLQRLLPGLVLRPYTNKQPCRPCQQPICTRHQYQRHIVLVMTGSSPACYLVCTPPNVVQWFSCEAGGGARAYTCPKTSEQSCQTAALVHHLHATGQTPICLVSSCGV